MGRLVLLSFVGDRAQGFRLAFVWAQPLLLGGCVTHSMVNAHLPDLFSFRGHIDDEPVNETTRPACLIINSFNGRRHNLEVIVPSRG